MAAGKWSDLEIAGHVCYVYQPASSPPHNFTVLYLHGAGLGRLSDHPRFGELFDQHQLRCLAPKTMRSWWSDRLCAEFDRSMTAERYILDRVLPWLADTWNVQAPQIALLGTSMGGQGALRLAYKHPDKFPVVAAIAPAVDYNLHYDDPELGLRQLYRDPEQARQDTATLHIHPLNWPRHQWFAADPFDHDWFEGVDRLRMKLYSLGVPYEADLETTGGGHSWEYYENMAEPAIRFIAERLEREQLRV
jgi:pimeloyl-ACP methyl ester carboxylesterase